MNTALPKNEFLWSHTRHEIFQACLRRYYYAYYAAWAGWLPDAPSPARDLYIFKRLLTRHEWVAGHIAQAIAHLFKNLARPAAPAAIAEAAQAAEAKHIEFMREEFLHSRSGSFRADPVHLVGLYEHTYDVPVPPEEWKTVVDFLPIALRNFAASPLAAHLFAMPRERLVAIDRPLVAILGGFKVRAHPSLVAIDDDHLHIYHWDAHPAPLLPSLRQRLAIHACLADIRNREAVAPLVDTSLPVRATAYSLIHDTGLTFDFAPDELSDTREYIVDSADEMLFPLADPATNDPGDGSAFDPSPSPDTCSSCPFRRCCPSNAAP